MLGLFVLSLMAASYAIAQREPQVPGSAYVRVSSLVANAHLIKRVQPVAPGDAVRIHGKVMLQVFIGRDGHVEQIKALSGHPMLIPAAIEAVRQWEYKPFMMGGKSEAVQTHLDVDFKIRKE